MNEIINLFKQKFEYKENLNTPESININCIKCGDTKFHLGINFDKKVCHCFKCNFSAKLSYLVKLIFNIDIRQNKKNQIDIKKSITTIDKKAIELPKDFRPLTDTINVIYNKYFDYLFNRKITLSQIKYYNIGTAINTLSGYIYIPIYDINNNQIYWVTRAISKNVKYKSILPKTMQGSYSKADCLFNINTALNYNEIYICEGAFDAISIGKNAVAIMGKYLSENQFKILIQAKFKKYVIALDNNATNEMYVIAEKIKQYSENVYITKYPDNRDINELLIDDEITKLQFIKFSGLKI